MFSERTQWVCHNLPSGDETYLDVKDEDREITSWDEANLTSSFLENGMHAPAIDIDLEAELSDNWLEIKVPTEDFLPTLADEGIGDLTESGFAAAVEIEEQETYWLVRVQTQAPVNLIGSKTPGHYHLYVDLPMAWEEYRQALIGLSYLGVVESGFCNAALQREMTFLRKSQIIGQQSLKLVA